MAAVDTESNADRAVGYIFAQCKSSYWQEAFGDRCLFQGKQGLSSFFFPKPCSAPLVVVPMNLARTEPRRLRYLFKEV